MKILHIVSIFLCLNALAFSQNARMIDQIRDKKTGTDVWWAGQDSWIIRSGDLVIGTDLYLDNTERIAPAPVTPGELAGVIDISFVTHAHGDHFDEFTTKILVEKSSCIFVMPESCLAKAHELKIPESRIVVAKPRVPLHNMYIDPSVILINTLNPDFIFPQHHSTIAVNDSNRFWAKGYPDEVKIRLSQSLKDKYHILKPGDQFVIE
jgi:hypothetical protein